LGGLFLWHCPAGFPGSLSATTLPCDVRTFLEGEPPRLLGLPNDISASPTRAPAAPARGMGGF